VVLAHFFLLNKIYLPMNLRKGKVLRSIVCMGKIAASVLMKLFINENGKCHSTDAP